MRALSRVWSTLQPKHKRIFAVTAFCAAMALVIGVFSGEKKEEQPRGHKETIKNVLTDKSMREVGMDSLSGDVRRLERKQEDMHRILERLLQSEGKGKSRGDDSNAEKEKTRETEMRRLREDLDTVMKQSEEREQVKQAKQTAEAQASSSLDADPNDPHSVFGRGPSGGHGGASAEGQSSADVSGQPGQGQGGGLKIASFSQAASAKSKDKDKGKEEDESIYMPAGSILTGVLINGMDAPTGQGARRDPFPSTLRLQKDAILPNRFRADVRECFLIVSGYGDLSSERAYLRGETISCVRDDGGVIEARLDSYAVGEDGKAGVRGRLVSKEGQLIAKSLMAGFLSGAADALTVKQMPMISLASNSNTTGTTGAANGRYRSTIDEDLLKGSAFKGASNALERIAQYYVSMAEGIFPVIEVDAGRQLDVVMTRGVKLQVKGNKGKK